MERNHVFHDPAGERWRFVRRLTLACAVIVTSVIAIFILSVLVNPLLPAINLRPIKALPHRSDTQLQTPKLIVTRQAQRARKVELAFEQETLRRAARDKRKARLHKPTAANQPLYIGFYVNWDDSSYQSLKRNVDKLDWVIPEWLHLQEGNEPLKQDISVHALNLIRHAKPQPLIVPILNNAKNGLWNTKLLSTQLSDHTSRSRLITELSSFVGSNHFSGICIDFEEVAPPDQPKLLEFMTELHAAFKARGWIVCQSVPFDDENWDYAAFAQASDYLLLMAYDQHCDDNNPGSIAAQDWFEQTLDKRLEQLDPSRTIVCIGAYGYDWNKKGEASSVTFQEALLEARDSDATVEFDSATLNPHFSYEEEDNTLHTVWFLDSVTSYNQTIAANANGCAGLALWRMGAEDPSLWSFFGAKKPDLAGLGLIRYGYDVDFEGQGEILQIIAQPKDGHRSFSLDKTTGLIVDEKYTATPSSYMIRRRGGPAGSVALTFDDGPDPLWTPLILNILKREHVPATFFIIGKNGQAEPGLVKRIYAEGHEIGNHTYTHPNLGETPDYLTDLEISATSRLIESLTSHTSRLFRAPYFGDAEPTTPDEVEPALRAQRRGYLNVGLHVDSEDWQRLGSQDIINRVIKGITNTDVDRIGQVVLLHDGGGDRTQTVAALPQIIHELKARGFRFVTVSGLLGLSRDQIMPPLSHQARFYERIDAAAFFSAGLIGWILSWLFLIGIVLGLARMIGISLLALIHKLHTHHNAPPLADDEPFVTVLVPAFNEERVIARTINCLLESDYTNFEIIVIDDGSHDQTSAVVSQEFASEPRVRLLTKTNSGKANSLNYGLQFAQGNIIVALDADTIFDRHAIRALALRFADERLGALAGNAKVGNRINLITRWQALEYITAQNLDRRAFALLDCITVVPGAVGAWRRELIEAAGGFAEDTLAEDQDLTLAIRRLGYRIGYEESAIAWTEAPDTVKTLAKQRFRWSYGTLQCMWKHRSALFRPSQGALGFIAMPNVWLFQIIFQMLSPIVDLMLVWTLIATGLGRLQHQAQYSLSNLEQVLFYYALFLAVDWLAAAFAFALEKKEEWSLLWWLFLQRFCYRQVMYYVMIKSVVTALRGGTVGWGKLERKATVKVQN